ncbi:MAG: sugar transferase [Candidatus Eisenbacteria bacterium]|nr:sugar transferase [Candidatus Eisenbacteria bacterium]
MTRAQVFSKRAFDLAGALLGMLVLGLPALLVGLAVAASSRGPVLFTHNRVGRHGRLFRCVKFRTMRVGAEQLGSVTTADDQRVTPLGRWLRRHKLDEIPQLWNVAKGDMSFVGPRPDVQGFADALQGADRVILSVRPGITGPATLRFRDEESLLARQPDPVRYNRDVVFPEKVRLNREYVERYSLRADLRYILLTVLRKP